MNLSTRLLIDGELVDGEGAPVDVIDPATGKQIVCINEASEQQVNAAVDAADNAFSSLRAAELLGEIVPI